MSLIPPIRSLVFKHLAYRSKLVAVILLLGKIMPIYSYCAEKGLVYIIIIAPFSYQPSSYMEYTKSNMHSSCNIYLVSDAKCMLFTRLYTL